METPTGIGRLCNWTPNPEGPSADEFASFGAYQRTLSLKCDEGNPGVITWTPDENTPDTVYYQCFTHRYLGWRINVLDACEAEAQASDRDEVYVDAEGDTSGEGIDAEPSIRHETKVRAGNNYLDNHPNAENLKNHNMNEVPPKVKFQVGGQKELNKLIAPGLQPAPVFEDHSSVYNETLDEESMNVGERLPNRPVADIRIPNVHSVQHNADTGLPLFLKHPPNGQYLRPAKVPLRRYPSHLIERRPMVVPKRTLRPFVIPQPAVLMNHYKPHAAPLMNRPANPGPPPGGPKKPVLVLGQSTEIQSQGQSGPPPQHHYKGPPPGRVPFPDHIPQGYMKRPERPYPAMLSSASNTQAVRRIPIEHRGKPPPPQQEGQPKFSLPINSKEVEPKTTIRPAENTGFKPQTVIVESGFRPISNRKQGNRRPERISEQRRRADIISEIDEAIEGDALLINSHHDEPNRSFEPMFIPSPRDDMVAAVVQVPEQKMKGELRVQEDKEDDQTEDDDGVEEDEREQGEMDGGGEEEEDDDDESPNYPKIIRDASRESPIIEEQLVNMDFESGEDKMAVAANRMDTYYLPPDNNKMKPNRDMSSIPVGAVVTYDGKAVLDTSLINSAPPNDINELIQPGKTEQLRNTPQFGPFKGEMPPLSEIKSQNPLPLPQLKPSSLNSFRNSIPVTEYSNPLTNGNTVVGGGPKSVPGSISTKLTLLKASERKRREVISEELNTSGYEKVVPSVALIFGIVGTIFLRT